jgi:hypothetical protein
MEEDGLANLDDTLGETVTDKQGHFEELIGEEDEGGKPEPFLHISIDGCMPSQFLVS